LAWLEERELPDEAVVKSWPDLEKWQQPVPAPCQAGSFVSAQRDLADLDRQLSSVLTPEGWERYWFEDALDEYRHLALRGGKHVKPVALEMVIGLAVIGGKLQQVVLCGPADQLLYQFGSADQQRWVQE